MDAPNGTAARERKTRARSYRHEHTITHPHLQNQSRRRNTTGLRRSPCLSPVSPPRFAPARRPFCRCELPGAERPGRAGHIFDVRVGPCCSLAKQGVCSAAVADCYLPLVFRERKTRKPQQAEIAGPPFRLPKWSPRREKTEEASLPLPSPSLRTTSAIRQQREETDADARSPSSLVGLVCVCAR